MRLIKLSPDQILTLCDFPVHSEHVLKMYFHMYRRKQGRIVPPCSLLVLSNDTLRASGNGKKTVKYNRSLDAFLASHPKVGYLLVDGTHKTTAAALARSKISAMVLESDKDFKAANEMAKRGDLFGFMGGDTVDAAIDDARKHFLKRGTFETVAEKTERMAKEKVIPTYMIEAYRINQRVRT